MLRWIYTLIFVAICTAACSPQKRLARKVARVEAFAKQNDLVVQDTIKVVDTVITRSIKHDTVFQVNNFYERLHDTIVLEKEKLKLQIYRVRDSVFIEHEKAPDTLIIENNVVTEKWMVKDGLFSEIKKKVPPWLWFVFAGLVVLVLIKWFFN